MQKPADLPLWLQLNKVSKKYMDALAAKLGHIGIRRHFFLLVAIGEAKGQATQQELADLLETDKVTMVNILDSLSDAGFIRRVPSKEDRRKHLIALTPKAERHLPKIRKVISDLNKRAWSNDTVNKLMAWMTDNQASGEDGAKYFLKENEALWTPWVSSEAAEKIKASL